MKLRNIYFELSGACNLACKHCYIFSDDRKRARKDALTPEVVSKVIADSLSLGLKECTFTGGEAFLRPDIEKFINAAAGRVATINLLTNLTLITAQHIEFLSNIPGLSISTSIDGLDVVHDEFRGMRGAFKRTVDALERLQKAGIRVKASVTIAGHNVSQAAEIFELLDGMKIPFSLARIAEVGRGAKLRSLGPEFDTTYTTLLVKRLARALTREEVLGSAPLTSAVSNHCGVGIDILYVMSNGEVGFCPTLAPYMAPNFRLGNILHDSIAEIWRGGEVMEQIAPICSEHKVCEHASLCRGGCRANAYVASGKIDACDQELKAAFDMLKVTLRAADRRQYPVV